LLALLNEEANGQFPDKQTKEILKGRQLPKPEEVAPPTAAVAKKSDSFLDPAINQLGIYLTTAVADAYRREAATKFSEGATRAGFNAQETASFASSLVKGDIQVRSGGAWGVLVSGDRQVALPANPGSEKVRYLNSFRTEQSLTGFLQRFATIKLIVNPAPPRDYKVVVNGEECPATEAGIYKVMPGKSAISTTRPSKPTCEWSGSIAPGAVQEVNCAL
jgi:hypothetical protein